MKENIRTIVYIGLKFIGILWHYEMSCASQYISYCLYVLKCYIIETGYISDQAFGIDNIYA